MKKAKVPMLDKLPSVLYEYIDNVVNVKTNGNCEYCAIGTGLGMGEDSWSILRVFIYLLRS